MSVNDMSLAQYVGNTVDFGLDKQKVIDLLHKLIRQIKNEEMILSRVERTQTTASDEFTIHNITVSYHEKQENVKES